MDSSALEAAHAERIAVLDPALPAAGPLVADDGYALLTASAADSFAAGVAKSRTMDPDSMAASWGTLRRHSLTVRAAGPEPAAALDGLLAKWEAHLGALAEPDDQDSSASVTMPSRDTALIAPLVRQGFAPTIALSVRPLAPGAGSPADPSESETVRVRPLTGDDVDTATELFLLELAYDGAFHTLTMLPSTRTGVRTELAESLERELPGAWLAERDGTPVGLVTLELPPASNWISAMTALRPVAYLGLMVVRPESRGTGVGRALARTAHRAAAEHGASAILLHHVLPNPLSTPFWFSRGYRPLWTTWQRRPAVRAR